MHPAVQLRNALATKKLILAPGAPDPLSAKIISQQQFGAVYMTGFGATASRLGMPDIGLMTQTEMLDHARNFVRASTVPVIADADTGYGGIANLHRTIEEYVTSGVAAIHLEDQQLPKRCGQRSGVKVIDAQENALRIKSAIAARRNHDMMVIARTDAINVLGIEEAVNRAKLYQDVGADLVFVDGIKRIADVEYVARHVTGPKVVSIVDGNETTQLTSTDLEQLGFSIALYPLTALFSAINAVQQHLSVLKHTGSVQDVQDKLITYKAYEELINSAFFDTLDHDFGWPQQ